MFLSRRWWKATGRLIMPVYENEYKIWTGEKRSIFSRILAFPKFNFLRIKGKKFLYPPLIIGGFTFLAFLFIIYARVNVKILENMGINPKFLLSVDKKFFFLYIVLQYPFLLFLTIMVGPGLISRDIRHKALPMILSKPVCRWEYLFGKFLVLFLLLSVLTWIPGFLLFFIQTLAVPKASEWRMNFWNQNVWLLLRIFGFSFLAISTLNLMVMMFSSLTSNHRYAGAGVIISIIGSVIAGGVADIIFRSHLWKLLSITHCVTTFGSWLFGLESTASAPPGLAVLVILVIWAVCIVILFKRTRAFQFYRE